jgi:sulfatase modifying factor 1
MVFVQGGTFQMGSNNGNNDEKPVHTVTVNSFYISKHEITVAQFKNFIKATNYKTDAEKHGYGWIYNGGWKKINGIAWHCDANGNRRPMSDYDYPVIYVSWNDAVAFCKWLSKKTGMYFRLPTEAEWEYAAQGGNKSNGYKYSGSNNVYDVAWFNGNSGNITHAVGTKSPNELGVYDMSGNVWEWCHDWYSNNYYNKSPEYNPQGPSRGKYHVLRGGSWYDNASFCRSTNRYRNYPYNPVNNIGFRIVR